MAGLAVAPLLLAARRADPTVECAAGRISGVREDSLLVFRGIRYGRAERFRAPVPEAPAAIRATAFGPSCPQAGRVGSTVSEDCLRLNIWTPGAAGARPVMVYFHGGAYSSGTAVAPVLDGARLAAQGDAVVVTVGHRLNAFGYLYLDRIDPRFPDSGNAGQLDLILALRWVQANIAAFGGDPGKVTLFGQSGGGAKIATLMAMRAAAGLFHRAATMSGQQVTVSGPQNATRRAYAFLDAAGTSAVDDLLAMPAQRLVAALGATDPILGGSLYFGPVLDMRWLSRHPFWPDAHPLSRGIPMILGNTRDETRAFFPPGHAALAGLSWGNIAARLGPELRVDAHPEWVVGEYRRLFPDHDPERLFIAATTASRSWRGQVIEAEARAAAGVPAHVYQLDFPDPAPHTADIPLVFGTFADPAARPVSAAMVRAFTRFAAAGDPGWPAYRLPERTTMIFDNPPRLENDPRRAERELFARIPYIQPGT